MSANKRIYREVDNALEQAEEAIDDLEYEGVFSEREDPIWEEDLDLESIDHAVAELETALDMVADQLTELIDPRATGAFTIDEILARFVRKGLVDKAVVAIASRLIECLGTSSSAPGSGLAIGEELDSADLKALVKALRAVVGYYENEAQP